MANGWRLNGVSWGLLTATAMVADAEAEAADAAIITSVADNALEHAREQPSKNSEEGSRRNR